MNTETKNNNEPGSAPVEKSAPVVAAGTVAQGRRPMFQPWKARAWLWPDHVAGKRETRRLRDEHNALVNQLTQTLESVGESFKAYDAEIDRLHACIANTERQSRAYKEQRDKARETLQSYIAGENAEGRHVHSSLIDVEEILTGNR